MYDWHQVTYTAELQILICNIHILPQTSLCEHYTVLILEGRGGVGRQGWRRRRRKEGDRGRMRT
jgi:hypothetical protein